MPASGELAWPQVGSRASEATDRVGIARFPSAPLPQEKDNWCWAAVCQTIASGYGYGLSQRHIVARCHPGHEDLDDPFYADVAIEAMGAEIAILDYTRLRSEVIGTCTRNEVIIAIALRTGEVASHAVCAFGLAKVRSEDALVIYDPMAPRKGATGKDLIKIVPVSTMAGGYLEGAGSGGRGYWQSAIKVVAFQALGIDAG